VLTDLGCPDCRGVLAVSEIGKGGLFFFECRVGHAFSGESLIVAKEDRAEEYLWSAIETFEELSLLHEELGRRLRAGGAASTARSFRDRAKRAGRQATVLREVLRADRPVDQGEPRR
jgi:two-component system chemotaxis response regulator CheB